MPVQIKLINEPPPFLQRLPQPVRILHADRLARHQFPRAAAALSDALRTGPAHDVEGAEGGLQLGGIVHRAEEGAKDHRVLDGQRGARALPGRNGVRGVADDADGAAGVGMGVAVLPLGVAGGRVLREEELHQRGRWEI